MAKNDEFDFEKEYGIDPEDLLDPEYPVSDAENYDFSEFVPEEKNDEVPAVETPAGEEDVGDYDLDDLLSDEFLASLGLTPRNPVEESPEIPETTPVEVAVESYEEADGPEDYDDDFEDEDYEEEDDADYPPFEANLDQPDATAPEAEDAEEEPILPPVIPAFDVETPELGEDFAATYDAVSAEQHGQAPQEPAEEDAPPAQPTLAARSRRRKKLSKERIIKEVYLPPIIAGLTLILLISFIGGAIGRAVKNGKDRQEAADASSQASASAQQQEIDQLIREADLLASGYDYDAAIAKIDSYTTDISAYPDLVSKRGTYVQQKGQLQGFDDPASIPNLSFHCLIVDPARAFADEAYGKSYNSNFVTTDEFSKILQQLYDNGFVLVDFDSFVTETTTEDGKTTYGTTPLYLPAGKQPIMLTETLVNYETYMIDGNGDGEADADGAGFASKLMIGTDGKITNEYVDASGNTLTGAYDLVPILEAFIEEHPDFSYRGARAILAVSGEDGIFGYRIMESVKTSKGTDYYNSQVEGAQKISQALRDAGYTIASYTYGNTDYGTASATEIQAELDKWKQEVTPVLGDIDMLVYAKGSDIMGGGDYSGNRYNVLRDAGYRYFISAANVPWASVNANYVRQSRIMVTGSVLTGSPSTVSKYFDPTLVTSNLRTK